MSTLNNKSPNSTQTSDDISTPSTSRCHRSSISRILSGSRQWYHGEMGNAEAEAALENSPVGSFLVRLQSSNRYFISVLNHDRMVDHLPINHLSKQFFFMGCRYDSMSELVDTFAHLSDHTVLPISAGFSLANSTSLISVEDERELLLCLTPYSGENDNHELSTERGDVLSVLDTLDCDWVVAKNERTGQVGCLPMDTVIPLLCLASNPCELPYFVDANIGEELRRMSEIGAGSFLLRSSTRGDDSLALLVNTQPGQADKFLIKKASDSEGGFILAGRRFRSVQHIVERYCRQPISGRVRLNHAICQSRTGSSSEKKRLDCCTTRSISFSRVPEPFEDIADAVNACNIKGRTIASTCALRKSREEKEWKDCWLTLSEHPTEGSHLVVSNSRTSSAVIRVLELSQYTVYVLDESVFNREGSVFLCQQNEMDSTGFYFCFRPSPIFVRWMHLLSCRLSCGLRSSLSRLDSESSSRNSLSILQLSVDKFRSDALKQDNWYSAQGLVNGVKICATSLLTPSPRRSSIPSIIFGAAFLIPFIPQSASSLQLALISHQNGLKKGRPFGLSPLIALPESVPIDHGLEAGFCFRAYRYRLPVMSEEDYLPLLNWLRTCPVDPLEWISDTLSSQHRSLLSFALVAHYLPQPEQLLQLIRSLVRNVMNTTAAENILRQDSLATSLLTQTLRVFGRTELEEALIAANVHNIQIPNNSDVSTVVSCIVNLVNAQSLLLQVLVMVSQLAEERFPGQVHMARRVVSAVFVLRFANPLVIGVMNGNMMAHQLAKRVQAAANMAASPHREVEENDDDVAAFRRLFGLVQQTRATTPSPQVDCVGSDWLSICCHVCQLAISTRVADAPIIPPAVSRLFSHHECSPS